MASEHVNEENVLYDLSVHAEWPQETENVCKIGKDKVQVSVAGKLTSIAERSIWTFLRSLGVSGAESPCTLPSGLVKLINVQLPWQFDVTSDGEFVAILQDQFIEIRCVKDEYSSILCKCSIARDPYPQWRKLKWNDNSTMIAYANSRGNVEVFDVVGTSLLNISSSKSSSGKLPSDFSCAVAGLVFSEHQHAKDDQWQHELLVINYQGFLKKYIISVTGEYKFLHHFSFGTHYPQGVSTIVYHPQQKLLVVGGSCPMTNSEPSIPPPTQQGITAWRCLSDTPHYKLVTDYDGELAKKQKTVGIFRRLQSRMYIWNSQLQDGIFRMSLSPDSSCLAAIHYSGNVSLWDFPSLRKRRSWDPSQQPGIDVNNPVIVEDLKRRKNVKEYCMLPNLLDISWWSNEALILARCNGAVAVSSAASLKNLLGTSPEWFEPLPQISPAYNGAFVGLECESNFSSLKRHLVGSGDDEEQEDSDDEEDLTAVTRTTRLFKHIMYYVTDMERFQPPRKRPRLVNKTYRLVCLKSTTPEELYTRKIEEEEYGEALVLAKSYGLDCDRVYQRQWRKSQVSVASIQDYLSKISKRSWVLHECLERVPENIDAMRELLQYGLRGTDLEALVAIGEGTDHGHFILCDSAAMKSLEDSQDSFNEDESLQKHLKHQAELLARVDFLRLTLEQREVCRVRVKFLQYLDRLATYEAMLGGHYAAEEQFDKKLYEKFRAQNIVEAAIDYARAGDVNAVFHILTYHGAQTLPHRLAILANFPETMSPFEYRNLLPEAINSELITWQEEEWREKDWSESEKCSLAINPTPLDLGAFLYEDEPGLAKFRNSDSEFDVVSQWYVDRVCQIEEYSHQLDNAVELVKLAKERDIPGLDNIYNDLINMEAMVYEGNNEVTVLFDDFQKMNKLDKLRTLMSASSEEMYIKNLHRWLVPFLEACEEAEKGSSKLLIHQYLTSMAHTDLSLCFKVIESSQATATKKIIKDESQLMTVALDCIYLCERTDQLSFAFSILECLPQRGFGLVTESCSKLHNQVDQLENHLSAAEILEKNGLAKPVSYLKDVQDNVEEAKNVLIRLSRAAGNKEPPLSSIQWKQLLNDMLELQAKGLKCITTQLCYEIYTESLLCSSRNENIKFAGEMLCRTKEPVRQKRLSGPHVTTQYKIPYERAVDLVLSAAQEYFNASANLKDPCMELARSCLNLMTDVSSTMQEEVDLISSLAQLQDFDVQILPLQVRLCSDRIKLIKNALNSKPAAYKKHEKLVKLGHLLRVQGKGESDVEGQILMLVTEAALQHDDYNTAYKHCDKLMAANYAPIWMASKTLAEMEQFNNIYSKIDLLCFAATHCQPDMIESILKARYSLETKVLHERLGDVIKRDTSPENDDIETTSPRGGSDTKTLSSSSKAMLSSWWKNTLNNYKRTKLAMWKTSGEDVHRNTAFDVQGLHPFYDSMVDNSFCDEGQGDYSSGRCHGDVSDWELLVRGAKLDELITDGENQGDCSQLFLQGADELLSRDTLLGLSYLLALSNSHQAEECFEQLPHTAVTLQLRAYYYALQIHNRLQPHEESPIKNCYRNVPVGVVDEMRAYLASHSEVSKEVEALLPWLEHYHELNTDFSQAQLLRHLGKDVNIIRFTKDKEYKHQIILELSRTVEEDVYDIAVNLAARYNLSARSVHMAHVTFLLGESSLPTAQIEKRITSLDVIENLLSNQEEFHNVMMSTVYPQIPGTDHGRLLYFFSLLEDCDITLECGLTAATQVKLLKKIKPALPGLDYKQLVGGTHSPVDVLRPVLKSANVHVVAKLAPKIPIQPGVFLHASMVYCAWALKLFWEGDQGDKKTPDGTTGWIHRYEACGEFMQKLLPVHVIEFIEGIAFTDVAVRELSLDSRSEFVKRAQKFCRQQGGKRKKLEDSGEEVTWEGAANSLQSMADHLLKMSHEIFIAMRQSDSTELVKYSYEFDSSRSQCNKLERLYTKMVVGGQGPDLIEDVLEIFPIDDQTSQSIIENTIHLLVKVVRKQELPSDVLEDADYGATMDKILKQIHEHHDAGGELIKVLDTVDWLRPLIMDDTVPLALRLHCLHLLEKYVDLTPEDEALIALYETQDVLLLSWDDKKVSLADMKDNMSKKQYLFQLLQTSTSLADHRTLGKLLQLWFTRQLIDKEFLDQQWMQILIAMSSKDDQECLSKVVEINKELQKLSTPLSKDSTEAVFRTLLENEHSLEGLKFVLASHHTQLYKRVLTELSHHQEPVFDEELCMMLLQRKLVPKIVDTTYYLPTVDLLLSQQKSQTELIDYMSVEWVVNQLREDGFSTEADTLMQRHRPGQKALKAAVGMFKSWFSK